MIINEALIKDFETWFRDVLRVDMDKPQGLEFYREEFVPSTADARTGYVTWMLDIDNIEACSQHYTGNVTGDLTIIAHCTTATRREVIINFLSSYLMPVVDGKRTILKSLNWSNTFIHSIRYSDTNNLFSEKTGASMSEVNSTSMFFDIGAKIK